MSQHHNSSVSSAYQNSEQARKLDEQFVLYMLEIENRYRLMSKHDRIRVEQWSKALCQVTNNIVWKKNRNLYTMMLLDQILGQKLEKPFQSQPPDGGLPLLSKTQVQSGLSNRIKELKLETDQNNIKQRLQSDESQVTSNNRNNQHFQTTTGSNSSSNISLDMPRQNTQQMYRTHSQQQFNHNSSVISRQSSQGPSNTIKTQRGKPLNNELPRMNTQTQPNLPPNPRQQQISRVNSNSKIHNYQSQQNDSNLSSDQFDDDIDDLLQSQQRQQELKQLEYQKISKYLSEIAQLKTQVEVLNIQVTHLKEEVQTKDSTIQDQNIQIEELSMQLQNMKQQVQFYQQKPSSNLNTQRIHSKHLIHENINSQNFSSYKQTPSQNSKTPMNVSYQRTNSCSDIDSQLYLDGPQSPPSMNQKKTGQIQISNNLMEYLPQNQQKLQPINQKNLIQQNEAQYREQMISSPSQLIVDDLMNSQQNQFTIRGFQNTVDKFYTEDEELQENDAQFFSNQKNLNEHHKLLNLIDKNQSQPQPTAQQPLPQKQTFNDEPELESSFLSKLRKGDTSFDQLYDDLI
ncbi:UNKNOWN [Stylonychia lemnae]|uniref:DUF4485 domain-containing protein n=1 Tax=Stylonychia lemnae TaxID=5949 RepID=A0A078AYD0_STYLE|nr:UNKNOWN [Stylonychia lemnae]|eukprot:CDW87141.1 UNKNOWN [Stylonychia lemnae]